ncbi:MAG: universal stress protein [Bacteroidales bacterium]
MGKNKKTIIVPTDFKRAAVYALQHAARVSSVVGEGITLAHVVDNKSKVDEATNKLESISQQAFDKYGIKPDFVVRVGDVAEEIASLTSELDASMAIMGSESITGKDEIKTLWPLNVITKSKVPFVTIQQPPINKRYDEIVFPIDFTVENKEKHGWINYFCEYYVSKFHLIKPNVSDPELVAKIDLNMASAVRYLDEKGAKYQVYTVKGEKCFAEEVLSMAVNIRADLIVIMTTKVQDDSSFVFEPHEEYIIGNAGHIPVMSINPR